jgi:hypothetical protein
LGQPPEPALKPIVVPAGWLVLGGDRLADVQGGGPLVRVTLLKA